MVFTLIVLAAAVAGLVVFLIGHARESALRERLRAEAEKGARAERELGETRVQLNETAEQRARAERELAVVKTDAATRLEAEQTRLAEHEKRAAQYLADVEKMRTTLQTEFQAVASKLLDEKSAKFTDHNKTQIDTLLTPLRQQLADFRARVDTVYKTDSDDRASLKAQIEQLRQLNVRITDEAHSLTQALVGRSQVRGAWGELVLERLLSTAGLQKGQDYLMQESLTSEDGRRLRPDVVLRLPDQRHLVIDSKLSLVAYERASNATEEAQRAALAAEHVKAVRTHVEELSGKRYEDTGQLVTPDYVLMFVPLEPAFALAMQTDQALYEWASERRVVLCTIPTLLVTLKTVALLWKQDRQTKNVQEIARRGGLLYDKFAGLVEDLDEMGRLLAKAQERHGGAVNKLKTGPGNLLNQVEELKTLGAKARKSLPTPDHPET